MADYSSYVVTIYKASRLHGERKRKREEVKRLRNTKKKRKGKNMKKNLILTTRSALS